MNKKPDPTEFLDIKDLGSLLKKLRLVASIDFRSLEDNQGEIIKWPFLIPRSLQRPSHQGKGLR